MTTQYNDTIAFEALVVGGTAVGFTAGTFAGAYIAFARVENAQVRYRTDGAVPTDSVGVLADPGDVIHITSSRDLQAIKFIRVGTGSAEVNAEFMR
ncbi:hypothetical protein LCGC14_0445050 [marine sediment metagenome]|uniref:Uncharacterized protein n=1 Tax=marine sediment metagenome TaxID=412755 RepID=A0A0F9VTF1_9ZZZZ